jgi:hypothetical protein
MKFESSKCNSRALAIFCCTLLILNAGCSAPAAHEPGPAETAGRYVDEGLGKVKRATVGAYRSSRRWLYDTGQRISRGSSAFADSWREGAQQQPGKAQLPADRHEGTYAPEDSYSFPREHQRSLRGHDVKPSYREAERDDYFPEEGSITSEDDFRY